MISELPFLTKLSICYSNIADQDLDNLGMNPRLRYLDVSGNKCIRSLTFLRCVPQLTSLDVSDTNITDDSINEVTLVKGLRKLALSETDVSDSITDSIEKLSKLVELDITDTKITEFGYSTIMTNCNIDVVYYH
jgi:Leucine-rich repeat (LRR) protein